MNGRHLTDDEFKGFVQATLEAILRTQGDMNTRMTNLETSQANLTTEIGELRGCARGWGLAAGCLSGFLSTIGWGKFFPR